MLVINATDSKVFYRQDGRERHTASSVLPHPTAALCGCPSDVPSLCFLVCDIMIQEAARSDALKCHDGFGF